MPVATGATAHESGSPIGVGEDEVGVVGVDRPDPCPVGTGFPRYDEVCGKTMRGWTGYFLRKSPFDEGAGYGCSMPMPRTFSSSALSWFQ